MRAGGQRAGSRRAGQAGQNELRRDSPGRSGAAAWQPTLPCPQPCCQPFCILPLLGQLDADLGKPGERGQPQVRVGFCQGEPAREHSVAEMVLSRPIASVMRQATPTGAPPVLQRQHGRDAGQQRVGGGSQGVHGDGREQRGPAGEERSFVCESPRIRQYRHRSGQHALADTPILWDIGMPGSVIQHANLARASLRVHPSSCTVRSTR